jgi:hypothetical protein
MLPARGVATPLAAIVAPRRLDLIDTQLVGKQMTATAQGGSERRHHPLATMLDGDRHHRHADVLATQRDQPDHVGQCTAIEFAGVAINVVPGEIVTERRDDLARRIRSGSTSD